MSAENQIQVIVADDELHIRTFIKTVMRTMKAEVIGEAKNGQEAVDLFRKHQPHIMLMDINMPVKDGVAALREIKSEFPKAFVLMLTSVAEGEIVQQSLEAGASGYLLKDTPVMEMKKMIREAWTESRQNT